MKGRDFKNCLLLCMHPLWLQLLAIGLVIGWWHHVCVILFLWPCHAPSCSLGIRLGWSSPAQAPHYEYTDIPITSLHLCPWNTASVMTTQPWPCYVHIFCACLNLSMVYLSHLKVLPCKYGLGMRNGTTNSLWLVLPHAVARTPFCLKLYSTCSIWTEQHTRAHSDLHKRFRKLFPMSRIEFFFSTHFSIWQSSDKMCAPVVYRLSHRGPHCELATSFA